MQFTEIQRKLRYKYDSQVLFEFRQPRKQSGPLFFRSLNGNSNPAAADWNMFNRFPRRHRFSRTFADRTRVCSLVPRFFFLFFLPFFARIYYPLISLCELLRWDQLYSSAPTAGFSALKIVSPVDQKCIREIAGFYRRSLTRKYIKAVKGKRGSIFPA